MKWWDWMPFSECWALSQLFHSPFSRSSRGSNSSSISTIRVMSSAYLRLLIFLPTVLIPACASSSPAFLMMYSAYKLNNQGDNIQPWCTPFPIWNQSVVPCPKQPGTHRCGFVFYKSLCCSHFAQVLGGSKIKFVYSDSTWNTLT